MYAKVIINSYSLYIFSFVVDLLHIFIIFYLLHKFVFESIVANR